MDDERSYWFERLDRDGYLDAELILDELFVHIDTEGRPCHCACHPSLGSLGTHGDLGCPCTRTAEERQASMTELFAGLDADHRAWEESEEGRAAIAKRAAERAELEVWIEADDGVEVTEWGGCFPEQWWGSVDGHSFYFREKRGWWSIEIDLRPTGRTYQRVVRRADDNDNDGVVTEPVEIEQGEVIAEGSEHDLGVTPLHHGRFIVNTIRAHLRRQRCAHPGARRYCPECGAEMA